MSLPVTAEPLPSTYTFGKVVGRVIHLIADTAEDTDDKPQARAAAGRVTFAPKEVLRKTTGPDYPAIVLHATESANLSSSGRVLDAEGRQGIWLAVGIYTVTFEITGAARAIPSFDIEVTTAHIDEAPLDLATLVPYVPPTGTVVQTVVIPTGGTTGQVLVRNASGGLVWADQTGGEGGTGAVASVNGKVGTVVLSAADVGAQPAGSYATTTALSDGLATKVNTSTYTAGLAGKVDTTDPRLTDARTPTAHTHSASQVSDSTATGRAVITATDAAAARAAIGAGTGNSNLAIGTTSTTAKAGDYAPPSDAAAGTASLRTLGTGATQAAAGNDARLSDQRIPADSSVTDAKVASGAAVSLDKTADSATRLAMTAAERTKLGGVATGATANSTDAQLRDRANHTGTQSADTITDGTTNKAFTATEKTKLAGITSTKYNASLQVYNLSDTAFSKWRLAYANQRNGVKQAIVACWGDSITAGSTNVTGDKYLNSYPGRLRTYFQSRTGVAPSTGLFDAKPAPAYGFTPPSAVISTSGTWNDVAGYGPFLHVTANNAGGTMTVTWTGSQTLRVYYLQGGGGGISTTTLDGTAGATFSSSGSFIVAKTDYVPTGSGAHNWTVTAPSGGNAYLIGFDLLQNTTSGVEVHNIGLPGVTTGLASDNSNTGGGVTGLKALAPDLTVLMFGTNDMSGAFVPVSTYSTNMQTLITAAKVSGDVILMTPPRANNAGASPNSYADYCNALYALSDSNDVPVLDLRNRYSLNANSYMDSVGHPTNTGSFDMAAAVLQAVGLQVAA